MRRNIPLSVTAILICFYATVHSFADHHIAALQPGNSETTQGERETDTLLWRTLSEPTVNFCFLNPGDSLAVWFKPVAPCSLLAIRFYPYDIEASTLFQVWDGSKYDGHIHTTDSTGSNGWIGSFEGEQWIPGPVLGYSPIGWNHNDPEHSHWGPFPYTLTEAHSRTWIEIPTSVGLQGEVDLGNRPFFITITFYIASGCGMAAENEGTTPFHFFKYYNNDGPYPTPGPDGEHFGWFLHSSSVWIEAVVKYYKSTPPHITHKRYEIDDDAVNDSRGNGNNLVESGERIEMPILIYNSGDSTAADVTATLWTDDPHITFLRSTVQFGDVLPDDNTFGIDPFLFEVAQYHPSNNRVYTRMLFHLNVNSNRGTSWNSSFYMPTIEMDDNILLLLDRFAGSFQTYTDVLNSIGVDYDVWSVAEGGLLPDGLLEHYTTVIWALGNTMWNTLLEDDKQKIIHFLNNGGNLFICGKGRKWYLEEADTFLVDYIHARNLQPHSTTRNIYGVRGNPVVGNIDATLTASWQFGEVEPLGDAFPLFTYDTSSLDRNVAQAVETDAYKIVYFAFALEAIQSSEDRKTIMSRILEWFDRQTSIQEEMYNDVPESFVLYQNYPNPFNATTDIRYQIVDNRSISLKIYNILGQEVSTLVNAEQEPGQYVVTWDGKDNSGTNVGSGIYFCRLSIGMDDVQTRKMILLR